MKTIDNINKKILLLLVNNDGNIEISTLLIDNLFDKEREILNQLCLNHNDNIDQIIKFIITELKPKIPDKTFKYCKELDKPYQSVVIKINNQINDIVARKNLIYTNYVYSKAKNQEYNLFEHIHDLKQNIKEDISLWFDAFEIDKAYEKAKKMNNVLAFSHRICGWSNPEFQITKDLLLEIKTNFGYGNVSYFYSIITFKNIQIIPLSEWVDYRYANFSDVIRYSKSFRRRIPKYRDGLIYFKTEINNKHWIDAMNYIMEAANLSLINEEHFIDKYIIQECETMISELQKIYERENLKAYDETNVHFNENNLIKTRVDINGFEMVSYKTEKIIGALDFIDKIIEYSYLVNTEKYIKKIKEISKKFMPNVYEALNQEKTELLLSKKDYNDFIVGHNKLVIKFNYYEKEKIRLNVNFFKTHPLYKEFTNSYNESLRVLNKKKQKIDLHSKNISFLQRYIEKFKIIFNE